MQMGRYCLAACRPLALAAMIGLAAAPAGAADGPGAPCHSNSLVVPGYADPPSGRNWRGRDLDPAWVPEDCIAWARDPFTLLTALAGRFSFDGSGNEVLMRFAAFSAWRGLKYWSTTEHGWKTLIVDSGALSGADASQRRADFSLPELRAARTFYFFQRDNRSSDAVVYRMTIDDLSADRVAISIENVSVVSVFLFTAFDRGDLKSTYVFTRLAPGSWGFYSLSGAREGAFLFGKHDASYLNRALAVFRHMRGIPGDQGPPIAP